MPRKKKSSAKSAGRGESLLTLHEVAKRTGISLATALRYKQEFAGRIPAVGEGRKQRYPLAALAMITELQKEKHARMGARRRKAAKPAAVAAKAPPAATAVPAEGGRRAGLISLRQIGFMTNISYPTLLRYLARHGERIPQVGKGRRRRFPPEAVEVFKQLRGVRGRVERIAEAGPRPPAPASRRTGGEAPLVRRLQSLEESHREISRQLKRLQEMLDRPWKVTLSRGR